MASMVRLDDRPHDAFEAVVRQQVLHLLEFVKDDNDPPLPGKQFLRKVQHFGQGLGTDWRVGRLERESGLARLVEGHLRPEALQEHSDLPEFELDRCKPPINLCRVRGDEQVDGRNLDDVQRHAGDARLLEVADKLGDERALPVAARPVQDDVRLPAQEPGKKILADFLPVVELVARCELKIVERIFHAGDYTISPDEQSSAN